MEPPTGKPVRFEEIVILRFVDVVSPTTSPRYVNSASCQRLEQLHYDRLSEGRKLVQCIDHGRHEIVSATMSSIVENLQSAGRPSLGQPPSGNQWSTYIEPTMDEHARDPVQLCGVPNQLVLLEKCGVLPIVSNEASEPQTKLGILVARIWSVTRGQGDMGVFPGTPFSGSEITGNRIRVCKHPSIGFDRPEMPKLFRYGLDKTFPMLRKHAPDVLGDPLHFAMRSRCDEREYQCIDPIGVGLGVGQSERAAPRQAKNGPPIDAAQLT